MLDPSTARFIRYLASKKTIDDRSLNAHVSRSFREALPSSTSQAPLRVLEAGAGIGTMIERLLDWEVLSDSVITAVDEQDDLLVEARRRLSRYGETHGYDITGSDPTSLELRRHGHLIRIDFVVREILDFAGGRFDLPLWDVLLAHAFLDLVDLPTTLTALTGLLRDSALLYLTINFDGTTLFLPEIDPALDTAIEALYHKTMDERRRDGYLSGDSRTGRKIFKALPSAGAEILDAGASDWVVFASESGYPADEKFFLEWILNSHESALLERGELDLVRSAEWIADRRRQLENDELIYITHQLDFLARMAGARPTGSEQSSSTTPS